MSATQWKPIYKSEIKPLLNGCFEWNTLLMQSSDLVNTQHQDFFKIEFHRSLKSGRSQFLGYVNMQLHALQKGQTSQLIVDKHGECNDKKRIFQFLQFEVKESHSFLDYIFGGCEVGLSVAVDFTLSNGDPKTPGSLHRLDPERNEYLHAIKSVGQILQYYDSDKLIPCFGYGAVIPPNESVVDHCFAVNGDIFNPECNGVDGVV